MLKITRRETLAGGGKAVAAVVALPFLSTTNPAQAQEDAELFALHEKCKQLEKEYRVTINRYDETSFAVRRQFPKPQEHQAFLDSVARQKELNAQCAKEVHIQNACIEAAKEPRMDGLAEAEEQAGVSALKKKHEATTKAWFDAQDRFYDMPANTPEGMILKLTNEWTDGMRRDWRAKGIAADVEYHPAAISSVLLDIERLSGGGVS